MINNKSSWLISIVIHCMLLVALLLTINHQTTYTIPGHTHIISAYLQVEKKSFSSRAPHLSSRAQPRDLKANASPSVKMAKSNSAHHYPRKQIHQQTIPQNQTISGAELNQLITLIYQTINKHKVYPEEAASLQQQGKVIVTFTLHPNGLITHLHIQHSSGYADLDQAALTTLENSNPIHGVNKYLHQTQNFSLPIAYQTSQ